VIPYSMYASSGSGEASCILLYPFTLLYFPACLSGTRVTCSRKNGQGDVSTADSYGPK